VYCSSLPTFAMAVKPGVRLLCVVVGLAASDRLEIGRLGRECVDKVHKVLS